MSERPGVSTRTQGSDTIIALTGDWTLRFEDTAPVTEQTLLDRAGLQGIGFDTSRLGSWDSSLLVYLLRLRQACAPRQVQFDEAGIPAPARRLLALLPSAAPALAADPDAGRPGFVERFGLWVIAQASEVTAVATLLGGQILRSGVALLGRARMRGVDLLACLYDAGVAALPMVALVNVLVGGILAFVGAIELRRFGADIYIANLVGIAQVREMSAVMTAIVLSGRTGGAYAAQISAMQGSNELDALRVIGIPVQDYLILPRVIALTLMTPLLYLYGCMVGIAGGFVVAVTMLNITPQLFMTQTRDAVTLQEVGFGIVKSMAFGALIALAGCRIGLKAGRSASDVGHAATSAVVVGIIGVITLDAVFAVCANALNI